MRESPSVPLPADSRADSRTDPLAEALDSERPRLRVLARTGLGRDLRARVDASDIVQQTLIEAYEGRHEFRGRPGPQLAAWLRRILSNNLANAARDNRREKRAVDRERPLAASSPSGSRAPSLAADCSSPSQRVGRSEQWQRLREAVEGLPPEQREVVTGRYLQSKSLAQVAQEVGQSKYVVAHRLRGAMESLRRGLEEG